MKRRENEDARRETKDVAGLMSHDSRPHQPWPCVRLGDVCEVRAGGDYKLFACEAGEYPVYGTGGEMGRVSKWRCPADSIIVGRKGTLDNPMFIREPFWNIDTCFGLIPGERVLPEFLFRFCQGFDFYSLVPASGRPSTTSSAIKGITVPLPPLAEQKAIVARLTRELAAVDRLAKNFEGLESAAEAEFKAELKETFDALESEAAKVKLGQYFKFIDYRGMTPEKVISGIPLITARNVRMGYLDYSQEFFISKEDYAKRQTRGVAHKGDLLFTTEAPLGFVAVADKEVFSTGQRIITFQREKKSSEFCNQYFLYYLMSDVFQNQVKANASGATAKGIKASRLVNLIALVPPLPVQREIVSRLTSSSARRDKLIALARQGRNAAAQLRKAILKEAFA